MREQENFLYAESQQVNALAQILLLDSRATDKTEKHIHGKEGSGSTSQFTRWCSLYEKKRAVGAVFAGDLGLNSAPEYMKAWKMNWWRWWCFRIWNVKDAAGVSKGLFCRSQPQRTFKRKDVHQYLLQKALAQSHTGFCLYVQDALTLCTRTSLLAAQESDFFLYLNPDPLRNLQHSYKQINKKPKLRRNSEYTKQSQGIQGRVIYMMQLFFFVGKSKPWWNRTEI